MFYSVALALGAAAVSSLVLSKLWPFLLRDKADALAMLHGPMVAILVVSLPVVLLTFVIGMAASRSFEKAVLQAAALVSWVGPLSLIDAARAPCLCWRRCCWLRRPHG